MNDTSDIARAVVLPQRGDHLPGLVHKQLSDLNTATGPYSVAPAQRFDRILYAHGELSQNRTWTEFVSRMCQKPGAKNQRTTQPTAKNQVQFWREITLFCFRFR